MDLQPIHQQEATSSSTASTAPQDSLPTESKALRSSARVKAAKQKSKSKGKGKEREVNDIDQQPSASSSAPSTETTATTTATRSRATTGSAKQKRSREAATGKGKAKEISEELPSRSAKRIPSATTASLSINEPVKDPKGKKQAAPDLDDEDNVGPSFKRSRTTAYSLRSSTSSPQVLEMPKKTRQSTNKGKTAFMSKLAIAGPSRLEDEGVDIIWLNCIIQGEEVGFDVPVGPKDKVSGLKKRIQSIRALGILKDVDPETLDLWKPKNVIDADPEETLVERIRVLGHDLSKFAVKLGSLKTVFSVFPIQPPGDHIHIIVKGSHTSNTRRASPKMLQTMSPRKETVATLYKKLQAYRFIQVRGTPASGKSTLAELLSLHIEALEPFTPVIWITGWSETITVSDTWREHLQNNKHWDESIASVLIFDEAQMTYVDTGLWNTLFKTISDHPTIHHHRIIIFTSYGSPTRINEPGTSMQIKEQQMVTLVPINHDDGLGAVGLYLTRPEFEEFANLRKYSFDPTCLDFIFRISSGHAGAINDVIQVISCDNSYRKITASQKLFTISDFSKNFTSHHLYAGLQGASIFRRGLPGNDVLHTQSVAHVLRTALRNKVIVDTMFPGTEESEALRLCFAQGWLHTDKGVSESPEIVGYFFASTLHRLFVEWKLSDQNQPIPIQAPSLLEFVIEIIQHFSPLNLSHPRTVGPYYFQSLPEAQYQDEFYRCSYDLTTGSLITLSEFGTADGRVGFYIPSKKWAVELLHDGQLLEQHNACFFSMGQYGTLNIDDYLVLDLRTKKVVWAHPWSHLPKLFHVIFSDDYHNVVISDGERTLREFSLIQTQS